MPLKHKNILLFFWKNYMTCIYTLTVQILLLKFKAYRINHKKNIDIILLSHRTFKKKKM